MYHAASNYHAHDPKYERFQTYITAHLHFYIYPHFCANTFKPHIHKYKYV